MTHDEYEELCKNHAEFFKKVAGHHMQIRRLFNLENVTRIFNEINPKATADETAAFFFSLGQCIANKQRIDGEEYWKDLSLQSSRKITPEQAVNAIRENNGNKSKAATTLGVSVNTIYRALERGREE
jgi:transcriptional regulator of acetoin/glycerol metabolism